MRSPFWRVLAALVAVIGCARAQVAPRPPAGAPPSEPAKQREAALELKFFDVQAEGQKLRMAYRDTSPDAPPNAPTVVLLHGKNFSGLYWEPTMRELSGSGYRVIAPDQIGFGASSKPDVHYSFHWLAQVSAQLLDSLSVRRAVVVGHSMGGMLAVRFALLYPDRVQKLVLEDPIGLEDYRTLAPFTDIDDQFKDELAATYASVLAYQKGYYVHWRPEYEAYVRDQARWIGTGEWPRVALANALTYEMIYTQPVGYELSRLTVPTLLVIGQNDRTVVGKAKVPEALRATAGNYPELGKKANAAIAGSKLVEIPECGHIPHVEAHGTFMTALLEWIRAPS
jgi:pimeloyl-ACP methyl ester carboxylesterase